MSTATSDGITITADNRGPLIKIATWIMLVSMILTTVAKLSSKVIMVRKLQADDYFIAASVLATIGNVIAVSIQVDGGLGQHIGKLSTQEIEKYEQSRYASQLFYVLALFLARLAVLWFLFFLARGSHRKNSVKYLAIFSFLWTTATIFVVAFQCQAPSTWAFLDNKCIDVVAFWDVFTVVELFLDIATSLLPIFLMYDLQLPLAKKVSVLFAFFIRMLLIPLIILRTIYITQSNGSSDATYDEFNMTLVTEIHLNASIIFACVPFLKPVMDSLQTGLLTSDLRGLAGNETHNDSPGSLRYKYPIKSTDGRGRHKSGWGNSNIYSVELGDGHQGARHDNANDGDASIRSRDPMLINQTTTIVIESEEDRSRSPVVNNIKF